MSEHRSGTEGGCTSSPAQAPPDTRGCGFPPLEFEIVSFPGVFTKDWKRASFSGSTSTEEVRAGRAGRTFGVVLVSACLQSQLVPKGPGSGVEVK